MITPEKDGYLLRYGGLSLPFRIETRRRKTLSIALHPDATLQVIAPEGADVETVLARVDGRAQWIAKQWRAATRAGDLAARGAAPRAPHSFGAGETHWFLGRAYRLKIAPLEAGRGEAGEVEGLIAEGPFLWITSRTPSDAARTQALLEIWYRAQAREVFALWLGKCLSQARSLGLEDAPPFEVRKMEKRWGSCTPGGKILLGLDLVKCPVDCIEYVLFHELCHLKHPHHGPEFYRLLERFLPDWKARKAKLEEWGEKI